MAFLGPSIDIAILSMYRRADGVCNVLLLANAAVTGPQHKSRAARRSLGLI